MIKVPEHIKSVQSYKPGKTIEQLIAENNWTQHAVLWNNENTLGVSEKAMDEVRKALGTSNYYPDPRASLLCSKIANKVGKKPENVILSNGSEGLLMSIIKAFCSDDDEFLTSEGTFVIVYNWAKVNNILCKALPLTTDYAFDLEAILKSVNRQTKVIYLSNVNNPTGTMITRKDLVNFLEKIPDSILVIVDEAYFEFSHDLSEEYPDSTTLGFDNVVSLRTFSKAYGIAGIRLGYAIASEEIISTLYKVRLTFEPSNLAQAAGVGAIDDTEFLEKTLKNNSDTLSYYYQEFKRLDVAYIPSYGNFIMTVHEDAIEAKRIFDELMKRGVFVRLLGGPLGHCVRVSTGRPDENKLCIQALSEVMD